MTTWQENPKITLHKATQLELPLQHNNENTDDATEEQVRRLIGQMLTQVSCICAFADFLLSALPSNSATPVMEEALLFALWAMETHLMSTYAQVKTLIFTSNPSQTTTTSDAAYLEGAELCKRMIETIHLEFFGEHLVP